MKPMTSLYIEIPFEIPVAFIKEYRHIFETLYGEHPHLSDGSIIQFGLEHYHYLDEFTPAYFDFTDDLEKTTFSLVVEPKQWPKFFDAELDPLSPIEELEEVFQFRFDLSFLAMRELVQKEKRFRWSRYDSIMQNVSQENAIHFLQGIKMMVLRDGGKLTNRDIDSFVYIDVQQKHWLVQYHKLGRWIRRYKYDDSVEKEG